MNRSMGSAIALALAGAVFPASAGITFSNVTIDGSLSAGATFSTGANDIDFTFPNATVGDTVDPIRSGNIVITYIATGTEGTVFDSMLALIFGELSGSGKIFFSEIIEDLDGGGVIGSYNAVLTGADNLPFSDIIDFSQSSDHIKVKKVFVLDAITTAAFDLASLSHVDQQLIPGPGTGALLTLAALPLVRRRRA